MIATPTREDRSQERRKRRALLLFIVFGALTLVMGVGLFAFYPNLAFPKGEIGIFAPGKPKPSHLATTNRGTNRSGADKGSHPATAPTPIPGLSGPPQTLPMGLSGATWTADVENLVPGDRVGRTLTLTYTGSSELVDYRLTVSGSPPNLLTTDTTHGLQLEVDRCSAPWTSQVGQSAVTATCAGKLTVVDSGPVVGSHSLAPGGFCTARSLNQPVACSVTDRDYLRFIVSFPASASDAFQGLSTRLTFTFSGSGS